MKTKTFLIPVISILFIVFTVNCGQKKKPVASETLVSAEVSGIQAADEETEAADQDITGKPLGVKSGIIEYTYSGFKTGKSTQYFDDYGLKSAVYTEIIQQGEESKGWSLTLGEEQYMWDPDKPGEGMKAQNPMATMLAGKSALERDSITSSMYEQMNMPKSGTEMFQGKECTVYKGDMGKVLIWKGLLMMMEMETGDVISRQEVTSIKTNIPVDGKIFDIPENITFNDIPGL